MKKDSGQAPESLDVYGSEGGETEITRKALSPLKPFTRNFLA